MLPAQITGADYSNENLSENTEKKKNSAMANFFPKMEWDDDITEFFVSQNITNSLNSNLKEVSSLVHTGATDYVKYNSQNVEPAHLFLSGRGGTGKSQLMKVIYNVI